MPCQRVAAAATVLCATMIVADRPVRQTTGFDRADG